jgi:steroid 5-alpha reductase family enzyme
MLLGNKKLNKGSNKLDNKEKGSMIAIPIILLIAGGIAFAGSQGSADALGIPLFALCVGLAFLIQRIVFIPSYRNQTEKFFDLTGGITYILVVMTAIAFSPSVDGRSLLLLSIVAIWAIRLGTFLFSRIRAEGEDRRFREMKTSFPRFLLTWTLQGLWVTFSLAAALAAITSTVQVELGAYAMVGFLVWVLGFGIEVIADRQKSQFRVNPENKGKFISTGLWSWSRHPNYFGEIVLWIGVAIIAIPILSGWTWLMLISPVFVIILLTRISGVPMLEVRADEKWGGQADYEAYKSRTSVLIPLPPSDPK